MREATISTLNDAVEALRQGGPVRLRSLPFASTSLGAAGFQAIIAAARTAVPDVEAEAVLDCGDAPGHVLGALRMGLEAVSVAASDEILIRLADIAAQTGARIYRNDSGVLHAILPPTDQTIH
jgi:hypothetical protein